MELVDSAQVRICVNIRERVLFTMKFDLLHSLQFDKSDPAYSCVASKEGSRSVS